MANGHPERDSGRELSSRAAVISVENPASGEKLATVPDLSADAIASMVAAARAAQPAWAELGFEGRAAVLLAPSRPRRARTR